MISSVLKNKLYIFVMVLSISFIGLFLYINVIQPFNAYIGMQEVDYLSIQFWFIAFVFFIFVWGLIPHSIAKPSDIFILIHIVFTTLPGILLWNVSGFATSLSALLLLLILVIPPLFIKIGRKPLSDAFMRIRFIALKNQYFYVAILLAIVSVALLAGYKVMGGGSFDFASSYERRFSGRENFGSGTFTAYLFSMSLNGLAPMLGFLAGYRKSIGFGLLAITFPIVAYWLVGTKAPIFFVVLLIGIGWTLYTKKERNLSVWILALILLIYILALIEYMNNNYSVIADVFVRRLSAVVLQNQGYFMDYMATNPGFDVLWGSESSRGTITYQIGIDYYGYEDTNANTNTFLYNLAEGGVLSYVINAIVLMVLYSLFDALYLKYNIREIYGVSLLFAILITEQSYTTTLITSGIAFLTILLIVTRGDRMHNKKLLPSN